MRLASGDYPELRERTLEFFQVGGGWRVRQTGPDDLRVNRQAAIGGEEEIRSGDVLRVGEEGPEIQFLLGEAAPGEGTVEANAGSGGGPPATRAPAGTMILDRIGGGPVDAPKSAPAEGHRRSWANADGEGRTGGWRTPSWVVWGLAAAALLYFLVIRPLLPADPNEKPAGGAEGDRPAGQKEAGAK